MGATIDKILPQNANSFPNVQKELQNVKKALKENADGDSAVGQRVGVLERKVEIDEGVLSGHGTQLQDHEGKLDLLLNGSNVTVDTYSSLPETGVVNTIYRVANWDGAANDGEGAVDGTKYSEYTWETDSYVLLAVKSQVGEIFDISEYHSNEVYTSLSDALGEDGANVPSGVRKGGMSIKFIQEMVPARYAVVKTENLEEEPTGTELDSAPEIESGTYTASQLSAFATLPTVAGNANAVTYYVEVEGDTTTYTKWVVTFVSSSDNNYVQYRYMGTDVTTAATFTNVANWQGVDDEPTANSDNLVKSGGVYNDLLKIVGGTITNTDFNQNGAILNNGTLLDNAEFKHTDYIEFDTSKSIRVQGYDSSNTMVRLCVFYDENKQFLGYWSGVQSGYSLEEFTIPATDFPAGTKYVIANTYYTNTNSHVTYNVNGSIQQIENEIANIESVIGIGDIIIPSKIYAVVGEEFNLYKDAVLLGIDKGLSSPANVNVEVRCDIGSDYERVFSVTPSSSHIGTHTLKINVYSPQKELLATKSISLVVIANNAPSAAKTYLAIGDSTLAQGDVTTYLIGKFASNAPLTIGANTRQLPLKNQGVGGWSIANYTSRGTAGNIYSTTYKYYEIAVEDTSDVHSSSVYQDGNGNRVTPVLVYDNAIQFTLSGSFDTLTSPLTKISGNGQNTIIFTDKYAQYANPFWNPTTNQLDISYYKNRLGFSGNIDVVSIRLGINDALSKDIHTSVDFETTVNRLKTLVDMFIDEGAKVIVELPSCDVSDEDAWGVNEGAGRITTLSKYEYQKDLFKLRSAIIAIFDNGLYNSNVEVGCAGLCIDRWYGYPANGNLQAYTGKVASVFNYTEVLHNNFVHPNDGGYKQLAFALYPQLLHLLNS